MKFVSGKSSFLSSWLVLQLEDCDEINTTNNFQVSKKGNQFTKIVHFDSFYLFSHLVVPVLRFMYDVRGSRNPFFCIRIHFASIPLFHSFVEVFESVWNACKHYMIFVYLASIFKICYNLLQMNSKEHEI